jgi:hypothetical protein
MVILAMATVGGAASGEEPAHPVTIVVFGDSQAAGLARGLQRVLVEDPHYRVLNRTHAGAALVHGRREWLGPIERFAAHEKADIAVVMFGANDRLDMEDDGHYLHFRSEEWRKAYAARIDQILEPLVKANLKILWCGNPIARSAVYTEDMAYINSIYAAEVARLGGHFIKLWDVVADDSGRYTAFGKDRAGETERLRADDGIHFTSAGYEVIAEKIIGLVPAAASAPAAITKAAAAPAITPAVASVPADATP